MMTFDITVSVALINLLQIYEMLPPPLPLMGIVNLFGIHVEDNQFIIYFYWGGDISGV
jgi:hypothetical protein